MGKSARHPADFVFGGCMDRLGNWKFVLLYQWGGDGLNRLMGHDATSRNASRHHAIQCNDLRRFATYGCPRSALCITNRPW